MVSTAKEGVSRGVGRMRGRTVVGGRRADHGWCLGEWCVEAIVMLNSWIIGERRREYEHAKGAIADPLWPPMAAHDHANAVQSCCEREEHGSMARGLLP